MWFQVPADAMRTPTRDTFYTFDSVGYNDYPFVNELASRYISGRALKRHA
jgi:hypothetical protein